MADEEIVLNVQPEPLVTTQVEDQNITINLLQEPDIIIELGEQGPPGVQGIPGPVGPRGQAGADGRNTVYVGSEAPTSSYYNVWIDTDGGENIDTQMSDTSTNPVENKVIKKYVDDSIANIDTDLTDYVKNTDYATVSKGGVLKASSTFGVTVAANGFGAIICATNNDINGRTNIYKPITPSNLVYAVNSVMPTMTETEYNNLATKDENLFYMIVEE